MPELYARFESAFASWLRAFESASPTPAMVRYHYGVDEPNPRRGKRLRPRMLLAVAEEEAARANRRDPARFAEDALAAATAIEILHNYSLVHDDIEDGDETRHGRRTVWAVYGVAQGINAGDAMSAQSYLSLLRPGRVSDPAIAARLAACLLEANLAMCWGQGLDISFEDADLVTYAQYDRMIEGKTAALFGAACAMGAIAAGADDARVRAYELLGRAYGRAFQIHDDILGIWGDPQRTGKPAGADIRRRKWSFPIVRALESGDAAVAARIRALYARRPPFDDATVRETIGALEATGVRAAATAVAEEHLRRADEEAVRCGIDAGGTVRALLGGNLARSV